MEFLNNMYTVFMQVVILAVMVMVGFFGDRFGFFTEKAARMCNDLLFYVVCPCIIVNSFVTVPFTPENASGFFIALGCAVFFHVAAIILSFFLFNKGDKDKNVVYKYAVVYGNTGYMGLPLAFAVMQALSGNGDVGVFYCSAAVVVFNLFCFTHGVWLMSGGGRLDPKKLILNPGTIPVIIGLALFLLRIKLPAVIGTPVSHIAGMNTPLAMVMFGTYLSHADLRAAFKSPNIYIAALVKLVLTPLAMIGLFRLAGVTGDMLIVASVFVSAPTASNTVMFSAKFGKDTALASQVTSFSSILSVLTMPACVALAILLS